MFLKRVLPFAVALAAVGTTAQASEAIEQAMSQAIPDAEIDSIQSTPLEGIKEVRYGTEIFYVSEDGRYVMQGSLIDLQTRENLTEQAKGGARAELFAAIDDSELVVYEPNGETRAVLNIFTDPNCPYCRDIHADLPEYLEAGVKVRYLMFPVLGQDSPEIMNRTWCADDRQAAMDRSKEGDKLTDLDSGCATPQDEHMQLGQSLGVRGTPALFTENGEMLAGYVEPEEVLSRVLGD
ncbi:DsbC family protein [Thioalkalivibrio sp. ALE19]|uniref:DsbC family protein n=1 Tax=Thioalkalivibrio sp. ALE19 TaxID=1266909 RepID=UPI0004080BF2|nr:DsbC family protein [Thioalkalivibrio sp. ALE19]